MTNRLKFCTQTAVAALLIGASGAAAQAQATDQMETVVVTGFRELLANALEAKKNSNLIMESVTAEDVGKMPDTDVAELLQRLPGVQINRDQGVGSTVLIDGLRQNSITLNSDVFLTGKEFYTYGEASGGGSGANIQYDSFSTIPSDQLGSVAVIKSPDAALTEGGIGGTIDLKTRNPLDSPDGFTGAVNLRGTSTSYQSLGNTTPNATLVGTYKPASTFAVTASVSYAGLTTLTHEMEAYNRQPWLITDNAVKGYTGVGPLNITDGETTIGTPYLMPEYMYFSNVLDQSKTIGATAAVTWEPTSAITTSVVWFFSHNWDRTTNYSNKVAFNGGGATTNNTAGQASPGAPGIDADLPYTIDANGVVQSATFYLQGGETATLVQVNNSDARNIQWHTNYDNGGPISASLDVSYSHMGQNMSADQEDVEHGFYTPSAGYAAGTPQLSAPGCNNFGSSCTTGNPAVQVQYSSGGSSGLPTAKIIGAYANYLDDPNDTLFKSAWAWANKGAEQEDAIRGAVDYKPSFLSSVDGKIEAGFRIAGRDVSQAFGRYLINGYDVNGNLISNCCYGSGNGAGLYYQDPGYASIPFSTATSNPGLALTVHNFALGNIIVKNPVTGGMDNPATFLNTIWTGASYVPGFNGVPAGTPAALKTSNGYIACSSTSLTAAQKTTCATPAATDVATSAGTEAFYPDTLSSFKVHEVTDAFYLMTNLGNKDKGFFINAGVRVVFSNDVVTGATSAPVVLSSGTATWNGVNSNNVPFSQGHYTVDILPSFNLELFPTDDQIVRLAAARVMSPADLFNLGLGQSYNFTRGSGCAKGSTVTTGTPGTTPGCNVGYEFATGTSGNPNLDPYRATQFNAAWEWYFAPASLISVGAFYKEVESFEVSQNVPTLVPDDFGGTTGPISEPVNGGHGHIYGVELSGEYALDNGFGLAANYTYNNSVSALSDAFSAHLPIPGVAANSFNATVFYEKYGIDARMSYSWRGTSLNGAIFGSTLSPTNAATGATPAYGVYTAPYGELDAQMLYNFTDNLAAFVGAENLTGEASHDYLQFKDQPFLYDNTGTRYFFGVKAKI